MDESDFADPFPTGLLHAVAVLVWNAVKADPAVKAPESAAAEPTLTTGDVPVFVVVTPSNPQLANTVPAALAVGSQRVNFAGKARNAMKSENTTRSAMIWRLNPDNRLPFGAFVNDINSFKTKLLSRPGQM